MKPKAKTLIEKMGFVDKDMKNSDHDTIVEWIDENIKELIAKFHNIDYEKNRELIQERNSSNPNMFSEHGTWEKVIKSGNYTIGFIDYHIGFYPQVYQYNKYIHEYRYNFYFEAKTAIPSMGELLRQIQFYKTNIKHFRDSYYQIIIVSYPNPRAQRIVESQGFFWIDYPGDKPKGKSNGQRTLL